MVFVVGLPELTEVIKLVDGYGVPVSTPLEAINVFGDVCGTVLDPVLMEVSLVLGFGTTEVVHPPLLHTVVVMFTVFKVDVVVIEYSVLAVVFGYK